MGSVISISDRKILSVTPTPPNGTVQDFERLWPVLAASLDEYYGPLYRKEHIAARIHANKAGLWVAQNSAIVGTVTGYPTGITVFNYWIQGGVLRELLAMHPGIEAWAKVNGCKIVSGHGREGWVRAMDGEWHKGPQTRYKWL